MTAVRRVRLVLAFAVLAAVATAALAPVTPAGASPSSALELSVSPSRLDTRLGDSFAFSTAITNVGRTPLSGLVAHLNVVSLTSSVYVDPEDWSAERTRYLPPLAPGRSAKPSWRIKAVNGGRFAVYVVVLPGRSPAAAGQRLAVSPAAHVHVVERKTLNAGGVLPLVLAVPALLGLLTVGLRARRRRSLRVAARG